MEPPRPAHTVETLLRARASVKIEVCDEVVSMDVNVGRVVMRKWNQPGRGR